MQDRRIKYHAKSPGKRSFSYTHLLLLLLIVVTPYSLNTASASAVDSKVSPADSKLIKELYESDKALNTAYRRLYRTKTVGARKILQTAQKQWIDARDNSECKTQGFPKEQQAWLRAVSRDREKTQCIIKRTRKRTAYLQATLLAKTVYTHQAHDAYPTYPQVWSRKLMMQSTRGRPQIYKQGNGDYLIVDVYKRWKENGVTKRLWNTVSFFSGDKKTNLDDHTFYKMIKEMQYLSSYKLFITHKGLRIGISGLDSPGAVRCPEYLNAFFFVDGRLNLIGQSRLTAEFELMKSLFYRLDAPLTIPVSHRCTETGERTVTFRIESMGGAFYDELDDGTVLTYIGAGKGVVVRLTPKLTSKAGIFGNKLIWVPTSEVKRLYEEAVRPNRVGDNSGTYKYVHDEIFERFKSIKSVK